MPMTQLRFDLHVHSHHSYDSLLSLESLVRIVQQRGLDGIALTDHDVLHGALKLQETAPFKVIPGEEINTIQGEITGLFLEERIPPHLSLHDTVDRIHAQGGLVYVPHPLSRGVPSRIRRDGLQTILPNVDIIEGFNGRSPLSVDDGAARQLAEMHGLPVGAGSDAHWGFEVGQGWVEMEDFTTPETFLQSLHQARIVGARKTPYPLAGLTLLVKWAKLMRWRMASPTTPNYYKRG